VNGPSAKTVVIRRADPPDGRRRQGSAEMACSTEMRQQTQPDSGSSAVDRLTSMCRVCRSHVGRLTTLRSTRSSSLSPAVFRLVSGASGTRALDRLGREVPIKSEEACKPTKSRAFRVASADGTPMRYRWHADAHIPSARRRTRHVPDAPRLRRETGGTRRCFSFRGRFSTLGVGHCVAVPIPGSPAAF
jgi:hypothetical protein